MLFIPTLGEINVDQPSELSLGMRGTSLTTNTNVYGDLHVSPGKQDRQWVPDEPGLEATCAIYLQGLISTKGTLAFASPALTVRVAGYLIVL